jgi:hypothetical protein
MTLGTIPMLQILLHPAMVYLPLSFLGLLIAAGTLIYLNATSLQI